MTPDNESIRFSSSALEESGISFMALHSDKEDEQDDNENILSDSEAEYAANRQWKINSWSSPTNRDRTTIRLKQISPLTSPLRGQSDGTNAIQRVRRANELILQQKRRKKDSQERQKLLAIQEELSNQSPSSGGTIYTKIETSFVYVGDVVEGAYARPNQRTRSVIQENDASCGGDLLTDVERLMKEKYATL
jgi:hypothetical protein